MTFICFNIMKIYIFKILYILLFQGVQIQSLGTFTFSQKRLDIGNNKFILIQRPVFNISEKFAQSQGLQYAKHHVPGKILSLKKNVF